MHPLLRTCALGSSPWWLAARHGLDGVAPLAILSPASGRSMLDGKPASDGALISRQGGVKYVIGKDGTLQQVAANVLAYDHASGRRRLRLEGQATNFIRNSTMLGAVTGEPGTPPNTWVVSASGTSGLVRTIVGVGIVAGMAYMDIRWVGTATSSTSIQMATEGAVQIPALSGQTWTHSVYIALIGGTWPAGGAPVVSVIERSSAGALLVSSGADFGSIGSTLTRVTYSRTLNNGSTAFVQPSIRYEPIAGAVVDFTIRIAAPQMEMSPAASSQIPTSGAAVTRPADRAPLWSGAGAATAWAWRGNVPAAIAGQQFLGSSGGSYIRDGSTTDQIILAGISTALIVANGILPGYLAFCGGWGASGRRASIAASAVVSDTIVPDRSRTGMFLGAFASLADGQILDIDELVAWRLPDRPSAAGCQGQARAWSA